MKSQNYSPITGNPDDTSRRKVDTPVPELPYAYVPLTMLDDPAYPTVLANPTAWKRLRLRHDFEYWAASCATIKHKTEGRIVPFRLNRAQRKVLAVLEGDRLAGRPIRLLLLKARQWGGSTLIQCYMAWIQSCLRTNWNSIICSQVKDTSAGIRGMYSTIIDNYPSELWEGDEAPRFKPYQGSHNTREITGRGCRVTISSIENQDAVRGSDFAMAHLSETAFWPATDSHSPADLVRAVCSSIAYEPLTLIAMESTANGVGNYFHQEWLRCEAGLGDKHAVFIPWYEIEIYALKVDDPSALTASFTPYEQSLYDRGLSLEQINWYRHKLREYPSHDKMMAEFPTTAAEAFTSTSCAVFNSVSVNALADGCTSPETGTISPETLTFTPNPNGLFSRWEEPARGTDYLVTVDIGGRTERADWSVIAVMTMPPQGSGELPAVVAQWRGHCDHDRLVDQAMAIGKYYNDAHIAIESNTLESGASSGVGRFVLERLADSYPNLYTRPTPSGGQNVGFHTNRLTKDLVISALIEAVRDRSYTERDRRAINEMLTYEQRPDGSYAAKAASHDDILMTRAIAVYLLRQGIAPALPPDYQQYLAYLNRPVIPADLL